MNEEPLIPLPKQRPNDGLEPVELLMLFLLWAVGITLGIFAFLAELSLIVRVIKANHQNDQGKKEPEMTNPEAKNVLPPIEVE